MGINKHNIRKGRTNERVCICLICMYEDWKLTCLHICMYVFSLDSFQALNVVETLKILCQSGCTVIMSIHQPRSSIFQLFDELILLAEGRLIYSGAAGMTAVNYFGDLGFKCPELFNPADYFLDIISVDNRSITEENRSTKRIEFLIDAFDKFKIKQKVCLHDVCFNTF